MAEHISIEKLTNLPQMPKKNLITERPWGPLEAIAALLTNSNNNPGNTQELLISTCHSLSHCCRIQSMKCTSC